MSLQQIDALFVQPEHDAGRPCDPGNAAASQYQPEGARGSFL
jgi:hypothetical protein